MKTFIGTLAALITVAFIGLLVLRIWNIEVMSLQNIVRSSVTLIVLGVTALLLIIIYGGFFKNNQKGYSEKVGNRAHPKL
jgi:c-di-AMP phosphodiesterase-like protein